MKLHIIGSIKINSGLRKKFFVHNLNSLKPISHLLSWDFNIVGKYTQFARQEIIRRYPKAKISSDDDSSYYKVVRQQISRVASQENSPLLFFWQEDHLFICPHKNLFFYLLDEFQKSKAEVLRITHLKDAWESKLVHKIISNKHLYKECLVSLSSQEEIWKKWPGGRVVSLPGIFKKTYVNDLLENNKSLLENSKRSRNFELHSEKAREFLKKRNFIEMIPTFYVLREVFRFNIQDRAIDIKEARQIIKLRDKKEQNFKPKFWHKIINIILSPRQTAGKIKRKLWKNQQFQL